MKGEVKRLQSELRSQRQTNGSLQGEIDDMQRDITRLEGEKSKAQASSRSLENELRISKSQVEELLSTNLDNENVIRMKVCSGNSLSDCRILKLHYSSRTFTKRALMIRTLTLKITKPSSIRTISSSSKSKS